MSLQKCFPKIDPSLLILTHNSFESFDIYSCSFVPVYYSMIQGSERVLYGSSQPSHSCHLRQAQKLNRFSEALFCSVNRIEYLRTCAR